LTNDFVNDARDRCGGIDHDTIFRNVFFRLMQSHNEFLFRLFSAPLIFRSLVKPPVQCVTADLQDKDAVKQVYEFRKVPRTTAEKRYLLILAGD